MLSARQAYLCMSEFLRQRYERCPTDEIGGLLGGMSLLTDGSTADAAQWSDWQDAIQAVIESEASPEGYRSADLRLR